MNPKEFWFVYGKRKHPDLAKVAVPISSVACSSAASESKLSVLSRVHTKFRGRLSYSRVEKLVFIKCNQRKEKISKNVSDDTEEEDNYDSDDDIHFHFRTYCSSYLKT